MSSYDIYTFILCFIVFSAMTALFTTLLAYIVRLTVRLIRCGAEDEKLKKEYEDAQKKKHSYKWVDCAVSLVLCAILLLAFSVAIYINIQENMYFDNIPTLKVVNSASMAKKFAGNKYLFQNDLNDQFNTFDILLTYKIPPEDELELYNIVVYEVDDILVVHRIVGIEEPNDKHPDERYFLCQGDAVENPDRFPVHYSQMRAIYRGESIPFVGSFVFFMQSPAGWLCVLLVIFAMIATPVLEKKINKEKELRLMKIGVAPSGNNSSYGGFASSYGDNGEDDE